MEMDVPGAGVVMVVWCGASSIMAAAVENGSRWSV